MDLLTERVIVKNILREHGIDTKDLYLNEYRGLTFEQEKMLTKARQFARKRVKELEDVFPFAFGKYQTSRLKQELLLRVRDENASRFINV